MWWRDFSPQFSLHQHSPVADVIALVAKSFRHQDMSVTFYQTFRAVARRGDIEFGFVCDEQ